MEVADLERGTRYTVILVATTGTEEKSLETDSDSEIIKTAGQRKEPSIYLEIIVENFQRIILKSLPEKIQNHHTKINVLCFRGGF